MKKLFTVMLAVLMVLSLAACGSSEPTKPTEPEKTETTYTLGMGVVVSTNSSKAGQGQVDATVMAVVTDAEGKIVKAYLDVAQNKMPITDGTVDATKAFKTKAELLGDYNMLGASAIGKEWYEQAAAFEEYCIGKTVAEIVALETVESNGHQVAADETLHAVCSMQITDFQEALDKASKDDAAVTFTTSDEITLGLACITTAEESTDATEDANGSIKMYTNFGAVVLGTDGKVLAALSDAIQPKIEFDFDGEIVNATFAGTKRELKEGYNMVKFAEDCDTEWYEQSAAFTNYVVGMTAADILAMPTRVRGDDEPHPGYVVTADETLFETCSISIPGFQEVLAKACGLGK